MATPTPVNAVWQYRMNLSRAGQIAMITTYLRSDGTPATPDYFNFCENILLKLETVGNLIQRTSQLLAAVWTIDSHSLQAVSPTRLVPFGRATADLPVVSFRAGDSLPINTSAAVERATADASRHGQGTLKPPFGVASDSDNRATWNAPFLVDLQLWGERMISVFDGINTANRLIPCIWSSGPGFPTLDFRVAQAKNTLRVVRRRTVGVGQ